MKKKLLILLSLISIAAAAYAYTPLDKSSVNALDRPFMTEYNAPLDKTATVFDIALFATPAITALSGEGRIGTTAVMYAETFVLAWGAKELLKHTISRSRPYLYYDNPPGEKKDDWEKSFPSGHTTMAFASAVFTSYTFRKYNPESPWRLPLTIGVYTIATATAALRIMSGSHFLTDVIAGAALGSLIGFGVPWLHTLALDMDVSATPFALAFRISF